MVYFSYIFRSVFFAFRRFGTILITISDDRRIKKMNMMTAVMTNDVEAAKSLIEDEGIDCQDPSGRTPLMLAIGNENTRMVEVLLKARPNIDIPDKHGTTALLMAAVKGNMEIVDILLRYMAENKVPERARLVPQESPGISFFD